MWRHEKGTVSCSFCISVDELMRGESGRERESHEPVPSAFFSPMYLPTRCLPPTSSQQWWNFSTSSLARFLTLCSCSPSYSHILSPFLSVTLPSAICVSLSRAFLICHSWTLPSSLCHFFFFFLSLHPTLAPSFLTESTFSIISPPACVSAMCPHYSKTLETANEVLRVSTVIVMSSKSPCVWSLSSEAPLDKFDLRLEGKIEQEIQLLCCDCASKREWYS